MYFVGLLVRVSGLEVLWLCVIVVIACLLFLLMLFYCMFIMCVFVGCVFCVGVVFAYLVGLLCFLFGFGVSLLLFVVLFVLLFVLLLFLLLLLYCEFVMRVFVRCMLCVGVLFVYSFGVLVIVSGLIVFCCGCLKLISVLFLILFVVCYVLVLVFGYLVGLFYLYRG